MINNIAIYVECYKEYCTRCIHNTTSDIFPPCKECGECINNLFDPKILEMTNFDERK